MPHIYSVNDQEAMCVRLHLLQEKWKKEILEEQERVRVCYRYEIQKLQETVREQEENIEEKIKQIVEEQERVRVCHRDEIQKLQETVREQEEKIKTLEWLMI